MKAWIVDYVEYQQVEEMGVPTRVRILRSKIVWDEKDFDKFRLSGGASSIQKITPIEVNAPRN